LQTICRTFSEILLLFAVKLVFSAVQLASKPTSNGQG